MTATRDPVLLDDPHEVSRLLDAVDFILTDCDGVIYLNNTVINGTAKVFSKLRSMGKKILFVSNNSTKSRKTVLKKLNDMGFQADLKEVFVSAYVVAEYFKSHNFTGRVYILGCQGIKDELDEMNIKNFGVGPDPLPDQHSKELVPPVDTEERVDGVIVGFDNMVSLPKLVKACTFASHVKPKYFVATNTDETFPTPNPRLLCPGTGAFVNFVKTAVGREPVVMGKPHSSYWLAIKNVYPEIDPKRTLMIGDKLSTDIAFGNRNGLGFTLLVETGVDSLANAKAAAADKHSHHLVPKYYLKSLNDLNSLFPH